MSYILEALRKSQQERELGHVPTLETPFFPEQAEGGRPNLWILVAVVLAALAVAIALYSAFRGTATVPEAVEAVADRTPSPAPVGEDPAVPMRAPTPPVAARAASTDPGLRGRATAPVAQQPMEPGVAGSSVVMEAPAAPAPPKSPEPSAPVAPEPPAARPRHQQGQIPDDLLADIEAFKQEVRAEQAEKTRPVKDKEKTAPEDLRLPRDVRRRLPEFVMSAHIYDDEPAKRFVLINGLKTREGDESREEITVEQILPDGAVLSFEGNRFFQRR
jgi:general secretion pathway protein B